MENGYPVHFCPFRTFPPKQNLEKHTLWKRDGNLEVSRPLALLQAIANQGQVNMVLPSVPLFQRQTTNFTKRVVLLITMYKLTAEPERAKWQLHSKEQEVMPTSLQGKANPSEGRVFTFTHVQYLHLDNLQKLFCLKTYRILEYSYFYRQWGWNVQMCTKLETAV